MIQPIDVHVAGIDVGSEQLHVAVVNGPVQVFETFTESLQALVEHLQRAGVRSVAMEATGVYWLPVYEALEAAGLQCCVVNGAHVKNVPGRKSDVSDCQWLAELHSHGLLRAGFVPPEMIRRLRDYQRLRQDHIQMGSAHLLHMQKALDRMNVKIHDVLSQFTGVTALRLVRAIVAGEREPQRLLALCDPQILRTKRTRMLKALQGRWHSEQLFALRQALAGWEFYQGQIAECDACLQTVLQELARSASPSPPAAGTASKKKIHHNAPHIPQLNELLRTLTAGQDLSTLPCLTDYSVLQVLSEVGTDLTRWPTAKHFVAWLGLAPSRARSGKGRPRRVKRFRGPAGRVFMVIARALARSKYLALGGFYRRLRATRGPEVANVAAARKIAILFYNGLRYGLKYVEQGLAAYEQNYRRQLLRRLERQARLNGMTLTPLPSITLHPTLEPA